MTNHNYVWNAFAEAEFLNSGDLGINLGDTFTMPSAATVTMSVLDNDTNEVSGHSAYIDGQALSGKIYAESYHDLHGSDGGTYYMIEIEAESHDAPGAGDVYFTFYGAVPPVGLDLTVTETVNVSGSWVDFASFGAGGTVPANTPPSFTNVAADGVISTDGNTTFATGLAASDAATCIEVRENEDFTYDVDSTNKLYTEDVWFAKKISCIEISTDQDDVDYAPDNEQLEFSVYINQDNLQAGLPDYDRMIDIDEDAILQAFRDLGLQNVRLDKLDENSDDLEFDVEVYFDGTVAEADAIVANLVFDIKYEDVHGNVKEATICTTVGDEEFDTGSPIAFDLNGTGAIETTGSSTDKAHEYDGGATVLFDIDGDGSKEHIEWMSGTGDGLLIDLSKVGANGQIDGNALFGDQGGQYDHGYEKLSLLDANNDGKVSGGEANDLAIWIDDGDAVLEAGEVVSLASQGISEVSTVMTTTADGRMVSTTVFDAEATGDVTYSLEGTDAAFFQINSQTGEISWRDGFTPDFEDPQDAGGDNIYDVSVKRSGEFCEDEIQPLQFCVEAKEVTCIKVCENQDFTYDVDSTSKLYTEDVWFAKKISCIEISTNEDEVDYRRDDEELRFQIDIDQEDLQAGLPDYDRMIDVDEEAILQAFRNLGLQNVRLDDLDEDSDDFHFEVHVHFDGTDAEADAIVANLVFDIKYEDVHGNVKEATICTTAGDEDFDAGSPIAFDLNGTGAIETTGSSTDKAHEYDGGATVLFDIDGDGSKEHIEWMSGTGDGLLIDLSKVGANGQIDGNALFGDQGGQYDHGYEKLSLLDANNDGKVSGGEANDLAIWIDDGDAVLEAGEVVSLASQGISEVSTVMTTTADGRMVSTTVFDAEATGDVTYSLEGADAAFFQINSQTGEISWRDGFTPDFENPQDAGGDNIYDVSVKRSGEFCEDEIQPLQFCVEDKPEFGSLSGRYFCDENGNNVDDGDVGVAGAIVRLIIPGTGVVATTTTAADGSYQFDNVAAGDYRVRFENPDDVDGQDGKVFVDANIGDDADDSDVVAVNGAGHGNTGLITVNAGENTSDVDAGIKDPGTASLAGRVFIDSNDNNDDDNNGDEEGLGGVTVKLVDGNGTAVLDGNGDAITTETAADGSYAFTGLAAGDYAVMFDTADFGDLVLVDQDAGVDDTSDSDIGAEDGMTPTVTLGIGDSVDDLDAGVEDPGTGASISGRYFCDTDGDAQDNGNGDEPGVEGAKVMLILKGTGKIAETFTDADGNYSFEGLDAGEYRVRFIDPEKVDSLTDIKDFVQADQGDDASDSDVTRVFNNGNGQTEWFDLAENETVVDVDAGVEVPASASLAGRVFIDSNDNNDDDNNGDEDGLGGVTVKLVDGNGTAVLDSNGDAITTETAADGSYAFTGLAAGDYAVMFDTADFGDLVLVDQDAGVDDTSDSDIGAEDGMTPTVTLAAGDSVDDLDAGVEDPSTSVIEGRLFCDSDDDNLDNNNGDEAGVGGVTVTLLNADGSATGRTTTTNPDGSYAFTGLLAGGYIVSFPTDVDGKTLVDQGVGVDTSDVDPTTGLSPVITVGVADTSSDNDAGVEAQPGSISGTYFCDENRDGDDDGAAAGDADVAGKTVTLLNADGTPATDIDGNAIASVLTDANGDYSFGNLAAGDYKVMFEGTDGKEFIAQDAGNDDTDDSDVDATGMTAPVTVNAGQNTGDVDAGVQTILGSLSGKYFDDANNNDLDDDGANGVGGVTVELLDAAGNPTGASTTTAADGSYSFGDLAPGTYGVKFTDTVSGKTLVDANANGNANDDIDSDATDIGGGMSTITGITVTGGNDTPDNDAGVENIPPAPQDDAAMTCADEDVTVDVLANDGDPSLTITAVDGQAITEGNSITTATGVVVTLVAGELVFDGEAAYAALDIGETALDTISYTVSDGTDTTDANVAVTFCGDANTVASLCDSLPDSPVSYKIADSFAGTSPYSSFGYDVQITAAGGDARFEGVVFEQAYCLDIFSPASGGSTFATAPVVTADMFCADDAAAASVFGAGQVGINGETAADNMDLITWILNQDYENNGAGSVDGEFTGWEVQFAIWELTNSVNSDPTFAAAPEAGQVADTDYIISQAIANGEGFQAGVGDVVGVILDPNPSTAINAQPFILAMNFEDYDCLC